MPGIDPEREFVPVNIAVLTVSDTRTPETDRSGDTLAARASEAGHAVVARKFVPDDLDTLMVRQLDGRFRPCNVVEILPRLREHELSRAKYH